MNKLVTNIFIGITFPIIMLVMAVGVVETYKMFTEPREKEIKKEIITGKFKSLYEIDPKTYGFIIYNKQLEQYDTIPHGQLENYISNDNL